MLFTCLCLLFFLITVVSRRFQGPAVLMKSQEVERALCYSCTRGEWFLPQRASRGRLRCVAARRRVAGVTLAWWRQSQDSDKTEKVKQNSCFSTFLCLTFYVSNWYDNVCPSDSLFENQSLRCADGWIQCKEESFSVYHISRNLSFLIKILTFRCLKQPVKIV